MTKPVLYWLPHCSTCKKAKEFLDARGVDSIELRDVKEQRLTKSEVERLAELAGGAGEVFSRRAIKYRELGLNQRELSEDEMIGFMSDEYTFIKRPVLVAGDAAISGFVEKKWNDFLEKHIKQ